MELRKYKLADIADIQTGPFGSQLHSEDYVETGTPIVTVEHLGERSFKTQNLPMVSCNDAFRLKKYCLQEGDIVFSRVGAVDRCSLVNKEQNGWLFSGRCLRVRANKHVLSDFLYYQFSSEHFKKYIRHVAVGCTMPSLNTEILKNINLDLPGLDVQTENASVLSTYDKEIVILQEINRNLPLTA